MEIIRHRILQRLFSILLLTVVISSCKKESINTTESAVWIKVLEDSTITSTDEEVYGGQNGKVITDDDDNIYLYFYSNNLQQTTVMQCSPTGNPVWRKTLNGFVGMDIIRLNDGSVVVAGTNPTISNKELQLHAFRMNGTVETLKFDLGGLNLNPQRVENANMAALLDNSIMISACYYYSFGNNFYSYCFAKISPAFLLKWTSKLNNPYMPSFGIFGPSFTQNSILPISNNRFLFQYAVSQDPAIVTAGSFGISTGILRDEAAPDTQYVDTAFYYKSGTYSQSAGGNTGVQNRYTNGLLADGSGGFIHHYSCPQILGGYPSIPAGFIRIGADATINDTIPIPLSNDYRIISCNLNQGRFLMTAYKSEVLSGTPDFNAYRTLFLTGGMDLNTTKTFSLQNFYSDFFSSIAPTKDGGFIIFGKIQSFNGSSNKVVLVKWK